MDRRKFIENSGKAILASTVIPTSLIGSELNNNFDNKKIKVVLVGTGKRGTTSWGKNLIDGYGKWVEMVGLCDINSKRVKFAKKYMNAKNAKTYLAKDFDLMIKETKPEYVIVTTTDAFHVNYITRAMELGCNVITEKPIATEVEQCQRILDTEYKTGKKVTVGFNLRFIREGIEMKKIIDSSVLGRILSIDFHEYLNKDHGSSYFRRWHGKIKYSGSLLVHKASHHFDWVNWLLDSDPIDVQAMGKVSFYGHNHSFRDSNCRTCNFTDKCDYYYDITKNDFFMNLYAKCEDVDGYYRDGCVWDNEIDTFDVSSVQVNYDNGTLLTYTMNTNLPYEGQYICFTGEKARVDVRMFNGQPWEEDSPIEIRISEGNNTKVYRYKRDVGQHGGADERIKDLIFKPKIKDTLQQKADSRAGVMASLIGIAARESVKTGQKIKIDNLVKFHTSW